MVITTDYLVSSHYLYEADFPKIQAKIEYETRYRHMQKLTPYYTNEKRTIRSRHLGEEWRRADGYRPVLDPSSRNIYEGNWSDHYRMVDNRAMYFILYTWISFTDPLLCNVGEDVDERDFFALFSEKGVDRELIYAINYPKPMAFQRRFEKYDPYWQRIA